MSPNKYAIQVSNEFKNSIFIFTFIFFFFLILSRSGYRFLLDYRAYFDKSNLITNLKIVLKFGFSKYICN